MALLTPVLFGVLIFTVYLVNSTANDTAIKENNKLLGVKALTSCVESPLFTAVRKGDVAESMDIYTMDCEGWTPMHYAVLHVGDEIVMTLLRKRFDVNRRFGKGNTVLFHAAVYGQEKPLRTLVDVGAIVDLFNNEGSTPLYEAVAAQRIDMARVLLSIGADPKKKLPGGNTYLHRAVEEGNFDAAYFFVGKGVSVDAVNDAGETSLKKSVLQNNPSLVNLLLARGAEVTKCFQALQEHGADLKNMSHDQTYLHLAVQSHSLDSLRALLESGLHPDTKACNGTHTPIVLAVTRDDVAAARILADFGADLKQRWDSDQKNLLDWAAFKGSTASIRWLVQEGLSVNITDNDGTIPLHYAARHNRLDAAKILVELNSCINCRDKWETPLHAAQKREHGDMVAYLSSVGGTST